MQKVAIIIVDFAPAKEAAAGAQLLYVGLNFSSDIRRRRCRRL